ncbi:hypothetical protein ENBRE01_2186 [Enteropsectra breve]|nr:hypothetical protein ENBRE01_2186 [Enteropsectra breve]
MKKLVDLINSKYNGISSDVICNYVRACPSCQRYNSLSTLADVVITNITRKYDRYMLDCVDLRKYMNKNDGFCWLLNAIDSYTKYMWSFKMNNKSAESVKDCLEYIVRSKSVTMLE